MFENISAAMKSRMKFLEDIDIKDRTDGTGKLKRLRQIPAETGKFLALQAANCPLSGDFVEIGTSAGYSALWISLALSNGKLKTFELLPEKINLAKETFLSAGVSNKIELIEGDFLNCHDVLGKISFCFIDCEKHLYEKCFDIVSEKMISGGMVICDNAINHYEALRSMMEKAEKDNRFDCLMVPIGKGEFICRRK